MDRRAAKHAGSSLASSTRRFFTAGDSREPELAGIWGARGRLVLTLLVTLLLSFPIGVAAAIYLEEFAPKNRWTDLIEVNINNLAAVPSIVFGLLGLAVFLELLRPAALGAAGRRPGAGADDAADDHHRRPRRAEGACRRRSARRRSASAPRKIQTVFHHVLPLAMPGMLTGTIIGMARALGETAPLLMIGMVAFIVDVPDGLTDRRDRAAGADLPVGGQAGARVRRAHLRPRSSCCWCSWS